MPLPKALELLAAYGWEELAKEFNPDCCIAASRIGLDVLRYFGVHAEPIVVELLVVNAAFGRKLFEYSRTHTEQPPADVALSWQTDEVGGWAILVGSEQGAVKFSVGTPGFGGHVVLLVEGRWLLDLSIQQANRPEKHINLPNAILTEVRRQWPNDGSLALVQENGCVLSYRPKESPEDLTTTPDWSDQKRHTAALRLIRRMEKYVRPS